MNPFILIDRVIDSIAQPITPHHTRQPTDAADFQRLVKLSYMALYTEEDGRPLGQEELVRLLVVANGYEMMWCVEDCAWALEERFEGYDDALAYFHSVPDSILNTKAVSVATKAAGSALAWELGPVEQLWRAAEMCSDLWSADFQLDEHVISLPIGGIEALLRSKALLLKSENITFSLALWWVMNQEGDINEVQQPLFNRLLKSLRYARMSAVFLASIAQLEWVEYSGLATSILTRGLWRRDDVPGLEHASMPSSRVSLVYNTASRALPYASFARNDIDALMVGDFLRSPLGFLQGFPCCLHLAREEDGRSTFMLFSDFLFDREDKMLHKRGEAQWEGQDYDEDLFFTYKLMWGSVGGVEIPYEGMEQLMETSADWSSYLFKGPANNFAYDGDRLKVKNVTRKCPAQTMLN